VVLMPNQQAPVAGIVSWKVLLAGRLNSISLDLQAGAVTAICGPNGAGKSSLLGCLAGLVQPDGGTVMVQGGLLHRLPAVDRARMIGYLPQNPQLAWDMSVATLAELGRLPWSAVARSPGASSAAQDAAAVHDALAAADMLHLASRPVSRLSGGEAMRAHLARVLAGQPQWVLADEPLAGLDLGHALQVMALLRAAAASGRGVALAVHDLAMAMNHADRVVVLDQGKVVADGPPALALSEAVLQQVWGVRARWLGDVGAQALALA
jgi:iron complex transport system ATP-binding protein